MISRARELAERPIADRERSRLFAAASVVLVLTAAVLLATGRDEGSPRPATSPPASPPAAQAPEPSGEPPAVPPAAEQAARRFLPGYLGFLYGRAGAGAIQAASPALRRQIVRSRPRVPPAARRRRPRVVALSAELLGGGAVAVSAQIAAGGVSRYPVTLRLRPRGGRWVVVEVGSD